MSTTSNLNIYIVTFNCGRALIKPPAFASHFFDALPDSASQSEPPDLIVLNLQEIASIAESFQGSSLPQYFERFKTAVSLAVGQRFPNATFQDAGNKPKGSYVDLTTGHAGLTAIMLFVRADLQHHVKDIMSADVGVGVQKMGNKGAVGLRIAWRVADSSAGDTNGTNDVMNLTFVSAHLAAMEEALDRRNQDYLDIVAGLVFEPKTPTKVASSSSSIRGSTRQGSIDEQEPLIQGDSYEAVDGAESLRTSTPSKLIGIYAPDAHLFFAGDLNYRTSITSPDKDGSDQKSFPQPASSPSDPKHHRNLLPRDQLTEQLLAGKTLHGLTEAPITFPPTYKYSSAACAGKDIMLDSEVTEWKWANHRWPSWCDRVLYSFSSSYDTKVTVGKYAALPLFATSDHRPVALSASVPLKPVMNREFAAHRPVDLDPNWKAARDAARLKEVVVGTVWYTFSTTDGVLNLTMGVAAIVCFAVLASVYAHEW